MTSPCHAGSETHLAVRISPSCLKGYQRRENISREIALKGLSALSNARIRLLVLTQEGLILLLVSEGKAAPRHCPMGSKPELPEVRHHSGEGATFSGRPESSHRNDVASMSEAPKYLEKDLCQSPDGKAEESNQGLPYP